MACSLIKEKVLLEKSIPKMYLMLPKDISMPFNINTLSADNEKTKHTLNSSFLGKKCKCWITDTKTSCAIFHIVLRTDPWAFVKLRYFVVPERLFIRQQCTWRIKDSPILSRIQKLYKV